MRKRLLLTLLYTFGLQTTQAAGPGHHDITCCHDIIDTSKSEDTRVMRHQYFPQTPIANHPVAHLSWLRDNGHTSVS